MTDFAKLAQTLRSACPELELRENEPLRDHCSFRIGGPCALMALPASAAEAEAVCRALRAAGEAPLVIGNGTNLLVTDRFLPRVVLKMGDGMSAVERRGEAELFALAGTPLRRLAAAAADAGLAGLEFAHGIPGTLGGAVTMNAGAYGGEMKDVLVSALWLDGELVPHESGELDLAYRHSRFRGGDVILGARVALQPGDAEEIRSRMRALMERRRASQPLDVPSAGSTFRRPKDGYAAALIDQAGLRGCAVGGAQVSPKHAGFVVNTGGATFDDVLRLIEHIQSEVLRRSGVALEPEIRIIRGEN